MTSISMRKRGLPPRTPLKKGLASFRECVMIVMCAAGSDYAAGLSLERFLWQGALRSSSAREPAVLNMKQHVSVQSSLQFRQSSFSVRAQGVSLGHYPELPQVKR